MIGTMFDWKPCRSRATGLDRLSPPECSRVFDQINIVPNMCLIYALGMAHESSTFDSGSGIFLAH